MPHELGDLVIYAGDAGRVSRRVLQSHSSGNVESSALRQHVAARLGFRLHKSRRAKGSTKIRLDIPNPKDGENAISAYIRSGRWRFVTCDSAPEAKDLQWYVIAQLSPALNLTRRKWREEMESRYAALFSSLVAAPLYTYQDFPRGVAAPGVYVLYHAQLPSPSA
jgi:hypothetical protein